MLMGVLLLSMILSVLIVVPVKKVSADAASDNIDPITFVTESGGKVYFDDTFKISAAWIDRSRIKVTVTGSNADKSILGNVKLKTYVEQKFVDGNLDGNFDYIISAGGDEQWSTIDRFGSLGSAVKDDGDFDEPDYIKTIDTSNMGAFYNNYLKDVELTIAIDEDDFAGVNCAGQDEVIVLTADDDAGDGIDWECMNDSRELVNKQKGISLAQSNWSASDLANFNIVYRWNGELGESAQLVAVDDDSNNNFVWCDSRNAFVRGSGCTNGEFIEGITPEDLDSTGGTLTLKDDDGDTVVITYAGLDHPTADDFDFSAVGATNDNSCEANGGSLSWILCPLLFFMDKTVTALDNALNNLLAVPNDYFEGGSGASLELAWSRLRNIALTILIPVMLVMVIGTALGFDFISAYTVKRALPRLIAAAIFISLSFYITKFLVVLTNDAGRGIYGLVISAFTGAEDISMASIFSPDGTASLETGGALLAFTIGGAALAATVSIGIILSYLFVALIAIAIGFILLSLRQMLIVALMILAPLAIISWIFPGNDKLWKLWWNSFSKLLLLFPLIMVLIATGKSFAYIVGDTADGNIVNTLIKLVAYIGPYMMIPATFKFAGGAFGTLSGMANNRGRGLFDRQKKYRGAKMSENWRDTKAGEKKFRPNSFNRLGERASVGMAGRFGIGERGQLAVATQRDELKAERQSKDEKLKRLGLRSDDGNAVMAGSGGTAAGARQAANELRDMWVAGGETEEAATARADSAYKSAMAVGVTRSRSAAAMDTLMQNKARSIAGGEAGNEWVENSLARLHGRNSAAYEEAVDSAAYMARESGRSDLGEVNGARTRTVTDPTTGATSVVRKSESEILDGAFDRTGAAKVVRGHTTSLKAHTDDLVQRYNAARSSGDTQALFETGAKITAMRNAMGQDMPEENKRIITAGLAGAGIDITDARSVDQQVGDHLHGAGFGGSNHEAREAVRDRAGLYDSGQVPPNPGQYTPPTP